MLVISPEKHFASFTTQCRLIKLNVANFLTEHCSLYVPLTCIHLKNEHRKLCQVFPHSLRPLTILTGDCACLIEIELLTQVHSTASSKSMQLMCLIRLSKLFFTNVYTLPFKTVSKNLNFLKMNTCIQHGCIIN